MQWSLGIIAIFLLFDPCRSCGTNDITAGPNVKKGGNNVFVMDENNRSPDNQETLLFTVNNNCHVNDIGFLGDTFTYKVTNNADDNTEIRATQYFDYETQPHEFNVLLLADTPLQLKLQINNIDDENPSLATPICRFMENRLYDAVNSTCTATVYDPDGWLNKMTFVVESTAGAEVPEKEIFSFNFKEEPDDSEKSADVSILVNYVNGEQIGLDYEKVVFYMFNVIAKDGVGHSTIPDEKVRVMVYVDDDNDMPPVWTNYFTNAELLEEEPKIYKISAIDGDKGIGAEIGYEILEDEIEKCISVSSDGTITVKPIDRDARDLQSYSFKVRAFEIPTPEMKIDLDITLYVEDIDDNPPKIVSIIDQKGVNVSDPKETALNYNENYSGALDLQITIKDIDMGENAQFNVELLDDGQNDNKGEEYSKAFLVVPNAGYRESGFTISVSNSTKLDYENKAWRNIKFNVVATGTKDTEKASQLVVTITLNDVNDEVPKFDKPEYLAEVKETIGINSFLIQVQATDADEVDKVLKHTLKGSDLITKLIRIEEDTGNIFVAVKDAFDYDRINPIFFQVAAEDKVHHVTIVPVTIKLTDVNNKAPTIFIDGTIQVEENQKHGTPITSQIIAKDVDTSSKLTAKIDWDLSYATKYSRRLDNSNETLKQQIQFVDIAYEKNGTGSDIVIKFTVLDPENTLSKPDYETFDSLYVHITVTDEETDIQFIHNKQTSQLILISIEDVNDNTPQFTDESKAANRTVFEDAKKGTLVGNIFAIDDDVGDKVTYSCDPESKDFDWFSIEADGTIKVKQSLNADVPPTYYVNYTCFATDTAGHESDPMHLQLYILDVNNETPMINIESVLHVKEQSLSSTVVEPKMNLKDLDRDPPYHAIKCEITNTECNEAFAAVDDQIIVQLKNDSISLDRDFGVQQYECVLECHDNPQKLQSDQQNKQSTTFTIKLEDVNNHAPELLTTEIKTDETVKASDLIVKLLATDPDEGDNAEINFNLKTVKKDGKLLEETIFEIKRVEEDYRVNSTHKQVHLYSTKDLKEQYGTYIVSLELSDNGKPHPLKKNFDLNIVVKKWNYYEPRFVFPAADKQHILLSSEQQPGKQLQLFQLDDDNHQLLQNIVVTDNENDICSDKWAVDITARQLEPRENIFTYVTPQDKCSIQLQVNRKYDEEVAVTNNYTLEISAEFKDGTEYPGGKNYAKTITIIFQFISNDIDPIFPKNTWAVSFIEQDIKQTASLDEKDLAFYPGIQHLTVFYYLVTEDDNVSKKVNVDENKATISLKEPLDFDREKILNFKIVASREHGKDSSKNVNSYLDVSITVLDINNHAPEWRMQEFFGAVTSSSTRGSVILTANATDADEIDDKLHYSIVEGSLEKNGIGLDNIQNPFDMNPDSGEILLKFAVENTMKGFMKFKIQVKDNDDVYGNLANTVTTSATISIISEENSVQFRFENPITEVYAKEPELLKAISETMGYQCNRQSINEDSINGVEMDNQTVASIYCLDGVDTVSSDVLKGKIADIDIFTKLRSVLRQEGLILMSFTSDTKETFQDGTLKAWLIGIAVVLAGLCIIMLVVFVVKIRELNKRILKLTTQKFGSQESGLNRAGLSLPTTNRHAAEGSNPVFNIEDTSDIIRALDQDSIHSGDSELIGVENDADFDFYDTIKKRNIKNDHSEKPSSYLECS